MSKVLVAASFGPAKVGARDMIALSSGLTRSHLRVLKYVGICMMAEQCSSWLGRIGNAWNIG